MLGLALKDVSIADVERIAPAAEAAGLDVILFPETGHVAGVNNRGRDPFLCAQAALQTTGRLRAGTGAAASPIRSARAMALTAATINEASDGRFILGCGVSHGGAVEALGLSYPTSPLTHATEYLAELRASTRTGGASADPDAAPPAGPAVGYGNDFPILLAALGPKMVRLAAFGADGLVLNWLTTAGAADSMNRYRTEVASRAATDPSRTTSTVSDSYVLVRCGKREALTHDARTYRDQLPNYAHHFAAAGLNDLDDLVDQTCMPDDLGAIIDRTTGYLESGAVPCIYPCGMTTDDVLFLLGLIASGPSTGPH